MELLSSFTKGYDEIYADLVENLRNENIEEEIVEGLITIAPYEVDVETV